MSNLEVDSRYTYILVFMVALILGIHLVFIGKVSKLQRDKLKINEKIVDLRTTTLDKEMNLEKVENFEKLRIKAEKDLKMVINDQVNYVDIVVKEEK